MITLIVSQSVLWAIASTMLLLLPDLILSLVGLPHTATMVALARVFGAELTGFALASYFTRHLANGPQRRHLALAYTASNTLGFVVTLLAQMSGVMSRLAWFLCALYFVYAISFGYLRITSPETQA